MPPLSKIPKELPKPTQRAYTLRLHGVDSQETSWREALWMTHEVVNRGAKAFGDWLLTLRGGLDHRLEEIEKTKKKAKDTDTAADRKGRRVLLVLSWLSVESRHGAPEKYIVAAGTDGNELRKQKVIEALRDILKKRGLDRHDIDPWTSDCEASLSAIIREDAVWVNRSKAFDDFCKRFEGMNRKYAEQTIDSFFGPFSAYLFVPSIDTEDETDNAPGGDDGPDFRTLARQWVSNNFGTGEKSDTNLISKTLKKLAEADLSPFVKCDKNEMLKHLVKLAKGVSSDNPEESLRCAVGWKTGRFSKGRLALDNLPARLTKSAIETLQSKFEEEASEKKKKAGLRTKPDWMASLQKAIEHTCAMPFIGERNHIGEFSVFLDHAARRVSIAHSWIRRAEAQRQRFVEDSDKINLVPSETRIWLDRFCHERTGSSGSSESYRIRKRAIGGWKEVVARWNRPECKTCQDRIDAARELQDNREIDKFGDIQLFEALAEDNALCVWKIDGEADVQPIINYAAAQDAESKQHRFKVPAYCHPDPLLHPVFCDFGNSRWSISYSIHRAISEKANVEKQVEKNSLALSKAEKAVAKSVEHGQNEAEAREKLSEARMALAKSQARLTWLSSRHALSLGLWNGVSINENYPLFWSCKRLAGDIVFPQSNDDAATHKVTRADRLGRAAGDASSHKPVSILSVFDEEHWNGRLQAPRAQLEAIADHVKKHGWDEKAYKLRNHIKWLLTFSPKLQPQGPWVDYCASFSEEVLSKPMVSARNGEYYVKHENNDSRNDLAKLILCRLPGLRVLSVDLGHRHAASCAVWEAVPVEQVRKECRSAGHELPRKDDLYLHLTRYVQRTKQGKPVKVKQTTLYRRIGADTLPDGQSHPSPWARLERQFLIKLQGEEKQPREALNEEIWKVHQLESDLGRPIPLIDRLVKSGWGKINKQPARLKELRRLGWIPIPRERAKSKAAGEESEVRRPSLSVDELMSSAVRTLRLALQRHGDRARIAFAMTAEYKTLPGDRKYFFESAKGASTGKSAAERLGEHVAFLQDHLLLWYEHAHSSRWRDSEAKALWDEHIETLPGYQPPEEIKEDVSGKERKKKRESNRESLRAIAELLLKKEPLQRKLHRLWSDRWECDDKQWKQHLRWVHDWILPRGQKDDIQTVRRVGGLSLTRLATFTEFRRQVQVGYHTRLHPDGTRVETKEHFGQRTLDALDQLREQRVKQLASRIAEAALGIGSENPEHRTDGNKRPQQRIDDPRFRPCHAVVIENLRHYRPDEVRTRRENRQLMSWASSKVAKYLAEACQLNGIYLREASASYTSRQDSRTGAPGMRCQDVPVVEFMRGAFWRKQVALAKKKQAEGKGDAIEHYLCELDQQWTTASEDQWHQARPLRLPLQGGEIFVSANSASPAARGLQADLNAAANIGLRALLDPDWPGRWWYVPCEAATYKPKMEKVKGSDAINPDLPLADPPSSDSSPEKNGGRKKEKTKTVINLWRDVSCRPVAPKEGPWESYPAYKNKVQARVVKILRDYNKRVTQKEQKAKEGEISF